MQVCITLSPLLGKCAAGGFRETSRCNTIGSLYQGGRPATRVHGGWDMHASPILNVLESCSQAIMLFSAIHCKQSNPCSPLVQLT